jgi:hypothetical protein
MRHQFRSAIRSIVGSAIGVALVVGGQAATAAPIAFQGTLSIHLGLYGTFTIGGSGIADIGVSGGDHLTSLELDAGSFSTTYQEVPVTDPGAAPIVGMLLTGANQAGSFTGSGGAGFGGDMPFAGIVKFCTYPSPCASAVANVIVPLTIGVSGPPVTVSGATPLTIAGAPWTTGTAVAGTATMMGGVAPLSSTGAASGSVTLVTPIFISSGFGGVLPSFGVPTLHFVPEPATLAFLAAGVAALAAMGRMRTRS